MLKQITIMMGLGHLVRRFFGGAGAILTFHRVRPVDETEFATGHLSADPDVLERLIRTLKADSWDFVTLTQALERRRQAHARPFVCLTFDDGYRDNIDILLPVAARHGVPITIFATAGFIDRSHAMWWYGIEEILRHADELSITVKGETRRRAAGDMDAKRAAYAMAGRLLTALAPADVATIVADLERRYGVDFLELTDRHAATWDMLREAARDPLVEIGAHTVSHAALGAADAATAAWEITAGRHRIESALGRPVVHFAYPYGDARAAGRREAALVRQAGFHTACTTRYGVIGADSDCFLLPRLSVGDTDTVEDVQFRMAGFGVLRRLLGSPGGRSDDKARDGLEVA